MENKFYDKTGTIIKLGNQLDIPEIDKVCFKDLIVVEEDSKLGLKYVCQDIFVPLDSLRDEFLKLVK